MLLEESIFRRSLKFCLNQLKSFTHQFYHLLILSSRYLANQFGLGGRNNIEKAQADEIVDVVNDLIEKRVAAMRETDESKKSTLTKEFMSETIPETLVSISIIFQQ